MALTYTEFDSTAQTLVHDLRQAIVASTDWTKISSTVVILTTSASSAVSGTTLTFASTTGSGLAIGSVIRIGESGAADAEFRSITAITATTITVAAMTYAHASGTNIYLGNEVLKATTTRGADMIVDLNSAPISTFALSMTIWRSHTGTAGIDGLNKFLYWRASGGALSHSLHVIVSASKEHLFVSVEGPRAYETGAVSTTAGSQRQYFFINDMVPYHAGDTNPIVIAGGGSHTATSASNMTTNRTFEVHQSRNYANSGSWAPAKLFTLSFQTSALAAGVNAQHQTTGDGKYYLSPYVVIGDDCGYRGRLASFFGAGHNHADHTDYLAPPVNTTIAYQSKNYKLMAVSKGDASTLIYGPFGGSDNTAATTYWRSPVVGVQVP